MTATTARTMHQDPDDARDEAEHDLEEDVGGDEQHGNCDLLGDGTAKRALPSSLKGSSCGLQAPTPAAWGGTGRGPAAAPSTAPSRPVDPEAELAAGGRSSHQRRSCRRRPATPAPATCATRSSAASATGTRSCGRSPHGRPDVAVASSPSTGPSPRRARRRSSRGRCACGRRTRAARGRSCPIAAGSSRFHSVTARSAVSTCTPRLGRRSPASGARGSPRAVAQVPVAADGHHAEVV